MSFSMNVKTEIAKIDATRSEYIAELSAIIRNSAIIEKTKIIFTSENATVIKRIYTLLKNLYDINIEIETRTNSTFHKKKIYYLCVTEKIELILEDLAVIDKNKKRLETPKEYIIDDIETKKAYLRGIFLCSGSINDPKTSRYHLELSIEKASEAVFVQKILNEFEFNAKLLSRDKGYMIYIKESEKISDFLKMIKAYNAVLYYEDIRIYREHKNTTNRLNNMEQANIDKIIETANEQLKIIELLKENLMIELLDDKTKEALIYREKYPDASLQELSQIISLETGNKITKSGLNHRFRKMKDLVRKIKILNEEDK